MCTLQHSKSISLAVVLKLLVCLLASESANADSVDIGHVVGNSNSAECKEILQAKKFVLSEFTDWTVQASGKIIAKVTIDNDTTIGNEAVSVIFEKGKDSSRSPAIILKSEELSKYRFNNISEISIRHKSGLDGKIRVVLKDADDKSFFSKSAITTRFKDWVETRRSYSPETIGSFSQLIKPEPIPPYRISHIMFILPGGKPNGQFGVSELTVRGAIEENGSDESIYSNWLYKVCNENADDAENLSIHSKAWGKPVDVGTNVGFEVIVERKKYIDKKEANLSLNIDLERYGSSVIHVSSEPFDIEKTVRSVSKIDYEFHEPGLYAMVARLVTESGRVISKKSKVITVWNPPGNNYFDNEPYFFGMMYPIDRFPETRKDDLKLMRQAGVKIVRFPFRWSDIEIEKNKSQWNSTDKVMSALDANGFTAQPMVFYTPDWASKDLISMMSPKLLHLAYKRPRWIAPTNPLDFAEFLTSAAIRYNNQSVVWEVWNEPTETQHWIGGNADDYLSMLRLSIDSFRLNSIDAPVLSAGIGIISATDQRVSTLLASYNPEIDFGYAIHSYSADRGALQSIEKANTLIENSKHYKDVWLNETGYLVDPRDVASELRRSSALVKTASVARFKGLKNFTWFIFRNFKASAKMVTDNYAIIDSEGSVRPPLSAYAHAVHMLSDTKGVSKLVMPDISSTVNAYVYEKNKNKSKIVVVWLDNEYGEISIAIPKIDGQKVANVVSMFGNELGVYGESDSIQVTHSPIFILYELK